tara:strand:- start:254 stop:721 length:468 start_codon:yes stop_codon:yes gene_type:complete
MQIVTTYGDIVYNDNTIKEKTVYQFEDMNTMVNMWHERDTNTEIEWSMQLEQLMIVSTQYVEFGKDVGVVQIDEVSTTSDEMIDRAWIRGRINKLLKLQKQYLLIKDKDKDMKVVIAFSLEAMAQNLFNDDDTFDRYRTSAMLCMRDLDLTGEEE